MLSYFMRYVKRIGQKNQILRKDQTVRIMKNKTMLIFFVVVIVIAMAIVIKGTTDRKERKEQDIRHAESVVSGVDTEENAKEAKYEFYQTDPDTGLTAIYTLETSVGTNCKGSGSITVDNCGEVTKISCAVKKENESTVFIFARYEENNTEAENFKIGDILLKLHSKEKGHVIEWVSLTSIYPGEEIIRNY